MSTATLNSETVFSHAESNCEAYRLTLGTFSNDNLHPNFVSGAKETLVNGNWARFLGEFGSHFAYDIVFGGRAIERKSYSRQTVSKL